MGPGGFGTGGGGEWYISADGKTYTFHLKEAYWSNGDQLTAADFERYPGSVFSQRNRRFRRTLLSVIKNAKAYREGKLTNAEEMGVKALDERVLQVVLEEPCSYFLNLLTFPAFFPVHSKYLQEKNMNYAPGFCTNGPFRIGELEGGSHAVLLANEFYRGKGEILVRLE